ncbi:MAG: hypothetical protein RLZZ381_3231 [Cyanobacteriota bacterium]|jgi:hypothetical protein
MKMNPENSTISTSQVDSEQRLEIAFDAEALATIDEIAKNTQRDRKEVISDALGLYMWANSQVNNGLDIGSIKNGQAFDIVSLPSSQKSKDQRDLNKLVKFWFNKV